MQIFVRTRNASDLNAGISYLIVGIIGITLCYISPSVFHLFPPCIFRLWTGIPCPSCGATHAGFYLSHLQLFDAFVCNPLFAGIFSSLGLWAINTASGFLFRRNLGVALSNHEKKIFRVAILSAIPLNWAYLIALNAMS